MVKDIIVIFRKNETILTLISLKRYFSHSKLKSCLTLRRHCNSGPSTIIDSKMHNNRTILLFFVIFAANFKKVKVSKIQGAVLEF